MSSPSKITPHLWFDKEAAEAAERYASLFPRSKITSITTLRHTPSGDTDVVSFELAGQPFMAISAGPLFTFNPSISFLVACQTREEVDRLWDRLIDGGTALMPLDSHPFSARYGWPQDRYKLSWQVMQAGRPTGQRITPTLMCSSPRRGARWPCRRRSSRWPACCSSPAPGRPSPGRPPSP